MAEHQTTCVIFNPSAARGRARSRLHALRHALDRGAVFHPTSAPGHAEHLAYQAVRDGLNRVVAAGGDGTVHEVANGILRAESPDVVFGVCPIGSANDYCFTLAAMTEKFPVVDVGWVRGDTGKERYFVNTLGLGFSGAVALESRSISGLRGLALYGMAFLRAWWRHYRLPVLEVQVDDRAWTAPTLSLTVALGQREGNFTVAPHARLDDGLFEILHAGPLSRWDVLRVMPALAAGKHLPSHPHIHHARARSVRIQSNEPLLVHLDGEFFSLPQDRVHALEVRLLPRRLRATVIP